MVSAATPTVIPKEIVQLRIRNQTIAVAKAALLRDGLSRSDECGPCHPGERGGNVGTGPHVSQLTSEMPMHSMLQGDSDEFATPACSTSILSFGSLGQNSPPPCAITAVLLVKGAH